MYLVTIKSKENIEGLIRFTIWKWNKQTNNLNAIGEYLFELESPIRQSSSLGLLLMFRLIHK